MTHVAAATRALRELAEDAHRTGRRSWAVIGQMDAPGEINDQVLEHDAVGRLLVRLDITQLVCVGDSRTVRGLHQGAIMEGSWGSESILVDAADEAVSIVTSGILAGPDDPVRPWGAAGLQTAHDVVTVLGGTDIGLWAVFEDLLGATAELTTTEDGAT